MHCSSICTQKCMTPEWPQLSHLDIDISSILKCPICQEGSTQPEIEVQWTSCGCCPQCSLVFFGSLVGMTCCPINVSKQDAGPHILWVGCTCSFLGSFQRSCVSAKSCHSSLYLSYQSILQPAYDEVDKPTRTGRALCAAAKPMWSNQLGLFK